MGLEYQIAFLKFIKIITLSYAEYLMRNLKKLTDLKSTLIIISNDAHNIKNLSNKNMNTIIFNAHIPRLIQTIIETGMGSNRCYYYLII